MTSHSSLSAWFPFSDLYKVHNQANRFFQDGFLASVAGPSLAAWAPEIDIHETPEALVLEADLPGVEAKDLDIHVENNTLTISGERKFEKKVDEENYLRVERSYGSFTRSFSLPHTLKSDAVEANYNNGVLTLLLPKREEAKPKQIKIAAASSK